MEHMKNLILYQSVAISFYRRVFVVFIPCYRVTRRCILSVVISSVFLTLPNPTEPYIFNIKIIDLKRIQMRELRLDVGDFDSVLNV